MRITSKLYTLLLLPMSALAVDIVEISELQTSTYFPEGRIDNFCIQNKELTPSLEIISTDRQYKQYLCSLKLDIKNNSHHKTAYRTAKYFFKTNVEGRKKYKNIRDVYHDLGSNGRVLYAIPKNIYDQFDNISYDKEEDQIRNVSLSLSPTNDVLIEAAVHACKVIMLESLSSTFCNSKDQDLLEKQILGDLDD